jgi:prevent-host-death family protein
MEQIAISKFKATCLGVLENVRRTRTPIRVTRFGKPVADIVPPVIVPSKSWLGCMRDEMEIHGDIVKPMGAFEGWEAEEP